MILAQNHTQTLILLISSALCWGLWAAVYSRRRQRRFEFFYVDVAIGAAILAVVCALTVGSLGFDGFSFSDDLMHAAKRPLALAFGAGIIFNLANMILMGAISVAGIAVAVPLGLGVSTLLGMGILVLLRRAGNPALLFSGSVCLLVAIIMVGVAYSLLISARQDQLVKEGKVTTTNLPGYGKGRIVSTDAPSAAKGLLLAVVSAALMWIIYPLINTAHAGETGLGPYSITFLFIGAALVSTFVFELFFINLPVEGEPLDIADYFRGGIGDHLLGWAAGMILCAGILAELVSESGPSEAQVGGVMTYGLKQGAMLVALVWGVWVSKDFRGAEPRVRNLLYVILGLMALGILLTAMASPTINA